MSTFCPHCENVVAETMRECPFCGKRRDAEPEPALPTPSIPPLTKTSAPTFSSSTSTEITESSFGQSSSGIQDGEKDSTLATSKSSSSNGFSEMQVLVPEKNPSIRKQPSIEAVYVPDERKWHYAYQPLRMIIYGVVAASLALVWHYLRYESYYKGWGGYGISVSNRGHPFALGPIFFGGMALWGTFRFWDLFEQNDPIRHWLTGFVILLCLSLLCGVVPVCISREQRASLVLSPMVLTWMALLFAVGMSFCFTRILQMVSGIREKESICRYLELSYYWGGTALLLWLLLFLHVNPSPGFFADLTFFCSWLSALVALAGIGSWLVWAHKLCPGEIVY